MEINGNTLKDLKIPSISSENFTSSLGKEKLDSLKLSVDEIQKLIQERQTLSNKFLREGDEIKLEIDNFLIENENSPRVMGDKDSIIEKNALRNKRVEISELQLKEKIDCWKDIANLKKELRLNERELSEKESRLNELNEILKEN